MTGSRTPYLLVAMVLALCAAPRASLAKDELDSIVKKDKLSDGDVATIDTVVEQRVRKLSDAAKNPKQLRDARDALIATATVKQATPAGLDAYAASCSKSLIGPVLSENLAVGLEATRVLTELSNARCIETLTSALRSPHAAVRYRAAIGIRDLHTKIAPNRAAARPTLSALGSAGALEENELVLRSIYEAIDFKKSASTFQFGDDSAAALSEIFTARLAALDRGSRDESKDTAGLEAAGRCFADANDAHKAEIVAALIAFLGKQVDRYCAADTAPEYVPSLQPVARTTEGSLKNALDSARVAAPDFPVSRNMAQKVTDAARKATRDGLEEWRSAVNKSPWPVR
ncbi:MAG: hypothetical protein KF841_06955 [Phycisphaerae bacterium]|nr:hypothetical protein [Phycisphaerae bacterium]